MPSQLFASDNAAGAHPEVLAALAEANRGHALAYGRDEWSARVDQLFRHHFGDRARPLLVFGGTAANVLALRPFLRSFESVLCARSAHLWIDEAGAPEHYLGCKLEPIESADGKLRPEDLEGFLSMRGDVHHTQPRVITITQPTEWGTLYRLDELEALGRFAREHDLRLHLDGARLANAAAALGVSLAALTAEIGFDSVSFGGTKNGLLFGEAVVVFDDAIAGELAHHRKQAMQLASKMRFLAAQFEALLEGDLWRRNAEHANAQARRLGEGLATITGVEVVRPVEANAVFVRLPQEVIPELQRRHGPFHLWDPRAGIARLMAAWDTEPALIDRLVASVRELVG